LEALETELRKEEYACLLLEPVMTNCGIIHPVEGYLEAARAFCNQYDTVFIIDEAHTITADHRGYNNKYKANGAGVPLHPAGRGLMIKTGKDIVQALDEKILTSAICINICKRVEKYAF